MRARFLRHILTLLLALATTFAGAQNNRYGVETVVLDAGHGGSDPGAVYGGVKEKDITLKVVLRLGKKIEQEMPGVKVVYTRTTDRQLAPTKIEDLQRRADIANKAEGDLFISVHVNAAKSTSARGVETLIMGETPKEQRYNQTALFESNRDDLLDMSDEREAAIIRAYIQNLQFTYGEYSTTMARCIQQRYMKAGRHSRGVKPQPLRVLYATNMPGVLTEIGFLSNKEEAAFLKSEKGINTLVNALFQALQDYSNYVLKARSMEEPPAVTKPAEKPAEKPAPKAEEKSELKKAEPKLYDERLYGEKRPAAKPAATTPKPTVSQSAPAAKPAAPESYYTVQVMASKRALPLSSSEFKSYRNRVHEYQGAGTYRYKYGVGKYKTRSEALEAAKAVKKSFPEAFVAAVKGN